MARLFSYLSSEGSAMSQPSIASFAKHSLPPTISFSISQNVIPVIGRFSQTKSMLASA
jgi:hypothetical protein